MMLYHAPRKPRNKSSVIILYKRKKKFYFFFLPKKCERPTNVNTENGLRENITTQRKSKRRKWNRGQERSGRRSNKTGKGKSVALFESGARSAADSEYRMEMWSEPVVLQVDKTPPTRPLLLGSFRIPPWSREVEPAVPVKELCWPPAAGTRRSVLNSRTLSGRGSRLHWRRRLPVPTLCFKLYSRLPIQCVVLC